MKKINKVLVYVIIPILIVILLYVNAEIQSRKYAGNTVEIDQYRASISSDMNQVEANPNEEITIPIFVKNEGKMTWIKSETSKISLSYHILNNNEDIIINEGLRTEIYKTVKSGEEISFNANIQAPAEKGSYLMEFDMVHEGVTWFEDAGSETFIIQLEVE